MQVYLKGDVQMSPHEKEREQEHAYNYILRQEVVDNPIPIYNFVFDIAICPHIGLHKYETELSKI